MNRTISEEAFTAMLDARDAASRTTLETSLSITLLRAIHAAIDSVADVTPVPPEERFLEGATWVLVADWSEEEAEDGMLLFFQNGTISTVSHRDSVECLGYLRCAMQAGAALYRLKPAPLNFTTTGKAHVSPHGAMLVLPDELINQLHHDRQYEVIVKDVTP